MLMSECRINLIFCKKRDFQTPDCNTGGADLGIKTLLSMEIFFNLLGFFEKTIPKHLPEFWSPFLKNSKYSLKIFLDTTLIHSVRIPHPLKIERHSWTIPTFFENKNRPPSKILATPLVHHTTKIIWIYLQLHAFI